MGPTLSELKNSLKEMRSISEKQEKRVRYLETKLTILVIFYILFQLGILLSISLPSTISCKHWSIPFNLSFIVAAIFGLTFTSNISQWAGTQYHYELNLVEEEMESYRICLMESSQMKAEGLSDKKDDRYSLYLPQEVEPLKPDMVKVYQRHAYIYVTAFALVAYTLVILRACHSLLCDDDAEAKP